ncbi:alpha-N-arabinofuranosidase [Aspergillus clavatus NRRL 1]|uniref:alpha-N-arabinofuranosidase n=1 Tax=Aspergillus clavatus (strain ATCC 1007 / CBS 513.65 / DSM 816 / NCTC 3887 / NRRL 1 / QM 1276 / 107) TaxID=344612 RepID=UPI0000EA5A4C|nr:alpha-L-arabinofuranosidase [Aspergillus clavatus NRRL 1]EAW07844.1 alpha-L-arabinofuranosidase [Aspergillus clavatus NRRL 1]
MTTFTKLSEQETPSIAVHASRRISKINPNIYAGFTEHMGRCIYGGIYDPGNPLSDENGFRKDVLEALKELNIPVVRYPGGNFMATYHWIDGVGPKDQRPSRPELAWLGTETNQFGTDEFMKWCELLGTEPYFCLNFGTALAWVEYCNGTRDTYYANLRRKNGREEPYNIKYWALGNEVWGPWQVAQTTKEEYAHKAYQWAKALKLLDPTLKLILCGQDGTASWDYYTLKHCILPVNSPLSTSAVPLIDMHSIHLYTSSSSHLPNVTAPLAAERAIEITSSLIDLAMIENGVPNTQLRPTICFDEWNVWDPIRAEGSKGAEESYTLSDALAVAVWLNVFVRKSKDVGMACIAQTVNVISPLMTTKDGIIKQTTWWPLYLFSKYMRGWTINTHVSCGTYEGETAPSWVRTVKDTPWLDVSATLGEDGYVNVAVVNISEDKDIESKFEGAAGEVAVFTVNGDSVSACNMNGKQEVGVTESTWDGKGAYAFPKHSLTLLRWKAE